MKNFNEEPSITLLHAIAQEKKESYLQGLEEGRNKINRDIGDTIQRWCLVEELELTPQEYFNLLSMLTEEINS